MKNYIEQNKEGLCNRNTWGIVSLVFNIGMCIGGFIAPPLGVIDNSVLIAIGVIGLQGMLPSLLTEKREVKIKHKDTTIEVGDV